MNDFGQANYNWNQASLSLSQQGKAYVLITIVGVTGSTPRNSGTKMVVSQNEIFDTIGGGHLEFKAIKQARKLLLGNKDCQSIEHFQLGSQLGQCCGGNASVLFECFSANTINIAVFGAGHVGQALIPILAGLPCQTTWVDSRAEQFPANTEHFANIVTLVTDDPASEVASMPANTLYVVMTHNHQLDFEISHKVLKRGDFHYLGLIASDTKWRRFQQRYKHRDVSQQLVERMNCPIGLEQVVGKLPMEVAVSISSAVIESYQSLLVGNEQAKAAKNKGIAWKEIKQLLTLQESNQESSKASLQNIKYEAKSDEAKNKHPEIVNEEGNNS
jgi:xanthine dehydrogenase accessory factor